MREHALWLQRKSIHRPDTTPSGCDALSLLVLVLLLRSNWLNDMYAHMPQSSFPLPGLSSHPLIAHRPHQMNLHSSPSAQNRCQEAPRPPPVVTIAWCPRRTIWRRQRGRKKETHRFSIRYSVLGRAIRPTSAM
ncbi:hypothetical protein K437DRAFT_257637 [Tilletiaria anomala UBC 951]|uniref:Uncharacterized protein n=1 Tax=Tilletiaria anomala (strain ATCC 24038 / CBS 436.72 / UBC 951) TaxID=1037660 RepID=A0A066VNP6_TILAU|nr:uncharacterized protein K437DRAFT_257637 [Tilletiaria anomala UBC 951]KDN43111.1 hypothetical protein K437DRAFT_257637 [Tilletiaria anomala UBC 951]